MNFLVSGATGFIGKRLVTELLKEGHSVRVFGRNQSKVESCFGNAVSFAQWEPAIQAPPATAFQGIDAIIHLAGEGIADKRWSKTQKQRIYDSRILGTRHLVEAVNALPTQPQSIVFGSAIGFYGDRKAEILSETSSGGTGFLADVCRDWELESQKLSPQIRRVNIRTGIVLGKEGGALKKLLPIFKMGMGGPVGNGEQWMSWIHIDDLVRLFIEAASNSSYQGPVNGVAPNPVTNKDFSKALGKALHRPAILPAPAIALKIAMGELSSLVLESQRVLPKVALDHQFQFRFSQVDVALDEIAKKKA